MQRLFLVVVIGYILGILWGQYISMSIVLLYIFITLLYFLKSIIFNSKRKFKNFSFHRYFRYIQVFLEPKIIIVICLISFISCNIVIQENENRINIQEKLEEKELIEVIGKVTSEKMDKDYKVRYEFNVKSVNYITGENLKFYIEVNTKKLKDDVKYGDIIYIKGEYKRPDIQRNYCGFDYNEYLKTKDIIGTINVQEYKIQNSPKTVETTFHNYIQNIKNKINDILSPKVSGVFIGIVLGDRTYIDDQTTENFKNANLTHILAVSGMHMTFLILSVSLFFKNLIGKRNSYIFSLFVITIYVGITGFSASILRSAIMGILVLVSKIIYRKNDIWNALAFSLLLILINNPFYLFDIGLQLSYGGTIGILLFQKVIYDFFKYRIYKIKKIRQFATRKIIYFINKMLDIISVTLSAQLVILPIMIYNFHTFSVYFLISNILASIIVEPLFIISLIFLMLVIISQPLATLLSFIVEIIYLILIWISYIGMLPYSQILIVRPYTFLVIVYFLLSLLICIFYRLRTNPLRSFSYMRFRNLKFWLLYKFKLKKKILVLLILFSIICCKCFYFFFPNNLKIYFVDVGQGDCTYIETPLGKKMLIDGGGSDFSNFDVGKQTLVPYLLNRRVKKIDFVFISHFDSDHVGGILTVLEEIYVEKVIIPKQFENSENYKKFLNIIMEKNINVQIVLLGDKIYIEKNLFVTILYPKEEFINENVLNNNSMVFKLNYNNFSILFTGDIEKIAEEDILKNINSKMLKSNILKVAHHGSKTSTIEKFLELVSPQIALIGVGKDNSFGHPSDEIVERLKNRNVDIYRTDQMGEICIEITREGFSNIKTHIK